NFRGDFRIGLPAHAMIGQEACEFGVVHHLPAQEVHGRLAQDADAVGVEIGAHAASPSLWSGSLGKLADGCKPGRLRLHALERSSCERRPARCSHQRLTVPTVARPYFRLRLKLILLAASK